jgi:hypothetical protein
MGTSHKREEFAHCWKLKEYISEKRGDQAEPDRHQADRRAKSSSF